MISQVIEIMHRNYGSALTMRDLAEFAALSPYHFTRKFHRAVGVPPISFLTAVRIAQAKRLLLSTSLTVSAITNEVGYSSVGTFTRRFAEYVGMSPARYRSSPAAVVTRPGPPAGCEACTIRGVVDSVPGYPIHLLAVGVFDGPLAQGPPRQLCTMSGPGPWQLDGIASGTYYLIAAAAAECWNDHARGLPVRDPALAGRTGPVTVRPGTLAGARITLQPWSLSQAPLLFPLPCVTAPGGD
jgi:AraC-like DNA-binding protein